MFQFWILQHIYLVERYIFFLCNISQWLYKKKIHLIIKVYSKYIAITLIFFLCRWLCREKFKYNQNKNASAYLPPNLFYAIQRITEYIYTFFILVYARRVVSIYSKSSIKNVSNKLFDDYIFFSISYTMHLCNIYILLYFTF